MKFLRILIVISTLFAVGCVTSGALRSKDVDLPLKFIQGSVVNSLPLGKKKVSRNGRTFYSKYFKPVGTKFKSASKHKTRFQAQVTVFGDRRPYFLEVLVVREQAAGYRGGSMSYARVGTDQGLARIVMQRIQKTLAKRREGGKKFDDFRAF